MNFAAGGFRGVGFDFIDRLKGRPINRHVRELQNLFQDEKEMYRLSQERLIALLKHASSTTGFYRPYAEKSCLLDYPIITKRTVKENYQSFLSSSHDASKLIAVQTSGSYGTPFTFYLSKEKRARQTAEVIYFSGWAGFRPGMKHALYEARDKSKVQLLMENQLIMSTTTPNEEWMAHQRQALKQGVQAVMGMASLIATVARYCSSKGDGPKDFGLRAVLFGGDLIGQEEINIIEKTFGRPALSRYATIEFGVLAQQCAEGKRFHVNRASYIVEVLRLHSDEPAQPGELGRIVVTDLFSHAMPLIRYDTGDLAIVSNEPCCCGRSEYTFESIEGRVYEKIYDTSGQEVRIHMFIKHLENVMQFQFIQTGRSSYAVNLCVLPGYEKEEQEHRIMAILRQRLGADAEIAINYVPSIERLPSGKRPFVINQYKRENR